MKVLQVHNAYRERGGEDAVVAAEAELLRNAGHVVHQLVEQNPESAMRSAARLAVAAGNPLASRRVGSAARGLQPDVAHVHNTWFSITPSAVLGLHRESIPVVMTLHNYRLYCLNAQLLRDGSPCRLCVGSHPWHGVRYRCYRGSAVASAAGALSIAVQSARHTWQRAVDRFIVLTEFARGLSIEAGLPEERIVVKPNFTSDPGPRSNPPSASDEVLFVGRLSPEKGADLAITAWRDAPGGLRLVVVGDGPERARLEAMAPTGVEFAGLLPAEEVAARMKRARALLFPSKWYEGQPMVLLEAFAAGLPVVANALGAMGEMLAHTPELLVSQPSVREWGDSLAVLESDGAVDTAGETNRSQYERRFQPSVALGLLEDAYAAARASAAERS